MFTFGSQVNPSLLRQDFSPILQAAQAQAQGTQQAAQIRAQSMAGIGSQISEGFKTYVQNREKNSILEGKNSAMLRVAEKDPVLNADPEFQKLRDKQTKNGGLSFADNSKMNALLVTYSEQNRLGEEAKARKLAMDNNQFQLEKARADNLRAENDRKAFSRVFSSAGELGRMPNQDEAIRLGLYHNMSPEAIASMLNMSQNSIEFGMKVGQYDEQIKKLKAENAETAARTTRINEALKRMPNGFLEVTDGKNRVFQTVNFNTGEITSKLLEAGSAPSAIQVLEKRQKDTSQIFNKYTELLNRADRNSPENIKARNELVTQFNIINPKDDVQMNQTRENLDSLWGLKSPVAIAAPGKGGAPAPATKSNITGVSVSAPGTQPTPAAAPATTASVPSLLARMGAKFSAGTLPRSAATPSIDTSVAAPTPVAPPPVDLSAPPSINAVIPMGPAGMERGEGADFRPTPTVSRALASAMRWADKNLVPEKIGLGALARNLNKPAFEAARAQELSYAQSLAESSDTPSKTFDEAMVNFGYRKSDAGKWDYKGPSYRGGVNPSKGKEKPIESSSIPFGPAGMDSTFLDRDARATAVAMQPEMETPLPFQRYQTPEQGPLGQVIKLSPAAQKIADEISRSARSGDRGKAPEFFIESSNGDNGKRTRIKLSQRDLDLFLSRTQDTRGEVKLGAEFQPFSRSYGQQLRQFRAR
jgi:hypothetical protein